MNLLQINSQKLLGVFLLLVCLIGSAPAQQNQLNLRDAVLKQYSSYYPERMSQLQWIPGTETMVFTETKSKNARLMRLEASSDSAAVLLTLATLNQWLPEGIQLTSFPRIHWQGVNVFDFRTGNNLVEVNIVKSEAKTIFSLDEAAEEITFSPDRKKIAFVLNHNIYVANRDGKTVQVTTDGGNGIVYGKSVHRNEFGINNGLFWAPNSELLAFYKMDESMVTDYPLVDISSIPAQVNHIKYPMAGQTSHLVTVGVWNAQSSGIAYLQTSDAKQDYHCSITWAPGSESVYVALLNRDQNHLRLNNYNAATGAKKTTLFEEKNKRYVEPEHALWFLPNEPNKFIWMSERGGFEHMYLYNDKGELLRPLTTGEWEVEEILGLDETGNFLFVRGTGETTKAFDGVDDTRNATQRYIYAVDINLGGAQIMDDRPGTHSAVINDIGTQLICHYTSIDIPWETSVFNAMGKKIKTLHTAADPLAGYAISKPEIGRFVGGGNGDIIYTRTIKPSHFDPAKKFPVLLYVYGGPHAQLITNSYLAGAPVWMYWMAEQGYIVVTADNRGSAHRGIEFEQATFRKLGLEEMVDQKLFVDNLSSLPYVDKTRMAIHGWSFGGFMTINMMLTFPGMFKAGVAGGPVCDWAMYEVMYTERYMDTPATNPDGYEGTNLNLRAGNLQDDLLIIHGTTDDVVVWQHSQSFLKACIDNEVQVDYFVYPGHPHNVMGKDRYHLMQKVLAYINERIGDTTVDSAFGAH